MIVLDSSFVGRHEIDACLWESMLENAILMPRYAWRELSAWRQAPFTNKDAAKLFCEAECSRNRAIILDEHVGWSRAYRYGRAFYNTIFLQNREGLGSSMAVLIFILVIPVVIINRRSQRRAEELMGA